MAEFTAPSGSKVTINTAPWADAKRLKMAIEKELDLKGGLNLDGDADELLSSVISVDGSPAVDAALWPCLARCLRGKAKITEDTFNDAEARKDYYAIVVACLKENLGPLVEGLFSELSRFGMLTRTQAKESTPESK